MRTLFQDIVKENLFPEQVGDYELLALFLESPRGDKTEIPFKQYGLDFVYTNFSIYEDIYSNCLSGSVTIVDANHLLTDFPIIGEETIEICFRSLNTPIAIMVRMRVTSISEVISINENSYMYTLYLTSAVGIRSEKQKITKSFHSGKFTQIIEYICLNYLKLIDDKSVSLLVESNYRIKNKDKFSDYFSIETESDHFEKYIPPSLSPFNIINKLCNKAISTTGSLFFFFQDINKFRLVSLTDLFKKRAGEQHIKKIIYIPKNTINSDNLMNWNIAIDYKIIKRFDVLKGMSSGMYSSEYSFVDLEKRKVDNKQFYYQRDAKEQYHLNNDKYLISTDGSDITHNQEFENPRTTKGLILTHHGDSESQDLSNHYGESFQQRLSTQAQINAMVIEVEIPGDSSGQLTVGDIVDFQFPKYERSTGDEYLTGKYLVTRIHHSVDISEKYRLIVELTSDTIATGYNVVEGDISTNVALPIKSKDITLEKDKSVVATSLLSSTIIDDYNEEDRIRRAQIKVIT